MKTTKTSVTMTADDSATWNNFKGGAKLRESVRRAAFEVSLAHLSSVEIINATGQVMGIVSNE